MRIRRENEEDVEAGRAGELAELLPCASWVKSWVQVQLTALFACHTRSLIFPDTLCGYLS